MKLRSVFLVGGGLALSAAWLYTATLPDTTRSMRALYPSARVAIHESHSPELRPILDLMRLVRGRAFIPPSEWVSIYLDSETAPVTLTRLQNFRIATLHLRRCRVEDISQLRPSMYAEFIDCDLRALPPDQVALLWRPPDSAPNTLYYGAP